MAPVTDVVQVGELADRLLHGFASPFCVAGTIWQIIPSIGIALYPDDEQVPSSLLRAADLAMHRAKGERGNRYAFYTRQMQEQAQQRALLEQRLRVALFHEAFSLVYQPIVDREGRLASAEALMRWEDAYLGAVSPAHFIPFAEQMGLMSAIGRWVLAEGIRQLARWDQSGVVLPTLSINLSAHQLYDPELIPTVIQLLSVLNLAPDRLMLEITESAMMQDPGLAKRQAEELTQISRPLTPAAFAEWARQQRQSAA